MSSQSSRTYKSSILEPDLDDLKDEVVQRLLKEDNKIKLCTCKHFDVWRIDSYRVILKVFKKHCCSNEYNVMDKLQTLNIPNFQRVWCEIKDLREHHQDAIAFEAPGSITLRSLIVSGKIGNGILYSVLSQCYYAMLVAFETQQLTHYNLNVDTIFVKRTSAKYIVYSVNNKQVKVPTFGFVPVITSFIYAYSSVLDDLHFTSRIDNVENGAFTIIPDFLGDVYSMFNNISSLVIKTYYKPYTIEDNIDVLDREIELIENERNTKEDGENDVEEVLSIATDYEYEDPFNNYDITVDERPMSSLDERSILTISEDGRMDVRNIVNFRDQLIKTARVDYNMKHHTLYEYDHDRDFVEYVIEYLGIESDGDIIFDKYIYITIVKIMNLTLTSKRNLCSRQRLCNVFSIFRKDIGTLTSKVGINTEDSFEVLSIFIDNAKTYIPRFTAKLSDPSVISDMSRDILAQLDTRYKYYSLPSNFDVAKLLRSAIVLSRGLVALFYNFSLRNRQELSSYIANSSDPRARKFKKTLKDNFHNRCMIEQQLDYNDSIILYDNSSTKYVIKNIMDRQVFNKILRRTRKRHEQTLEHIIEFAEVSNIPMYYNPYQ